MQRPLLLTGFMAAGKTSVGRRVAELKGVPFIDLDSAIESASGRSIADLFATDGEAEFRRLEREVLMRVLDHPDARVVALGGGALLDRASRLRALDSAIVVSLEARLEVILERASSSERPLLNVDEREARARQLLEARRAAYAEAHARIDTSELDVEAAAHAVLAAWERDAVAVALGERSYSVEVRPNLIESRWAETLAGATRVLLVTDENVNGFHGERALKALSKGTAALVLPAGEQHKTPRTLERIWQAALDAELDRGSVLCALGGGVVTDMAGFAAATFMRGIRWVALPSSLLAMVDASVGGKTAIDLGDAKNAVGAFWQPSHVLCDVTLLETEPERGFRSAFAEVIKAALIADEALFDLLEARADDALAREPSLMREIVRRSIAVKASIVSRDERESGLRMRLNLGHTVGHALEAATEYTAYTHGEAISLGLIAALEVGRALGATPPALPARVRELLARFGLPVELARSPLETALGLLSRDKKRRGTYIQFVVAHDIGRADIVRIEPDEIRRVLISA